MNMSRVRGKRDVSPVFVALRQAIDDDCNQTGQMTAALLDWPQVCMCVLFARVHTNTHTA